MDPYRSAVPVEGARDVPPPQLLALSVDAHALTAAFVEAGVLAVTVASPGALPRSALVDIPPHDGIEIQRYLAVAAREAWACFARGDRCALGVEGASASVEGTPVRIALPVPDGVRFDLAMSAFEGRPALTAAWPERAGASQRWVGVWATDGTPWVAAHPAPTSSREVLAATTNAHGAAAVFATDRPSEIDVVTFPRTGQPIERTVSLRDDERCVDHCGRSVTFSKHRPTHRDLRPGRTSHCASFRPGM